MPAAAMSRCTPAELRAHADAIEEAQKLEDEVAARRAEQEVLLLAKKKAVNDDRLFACQVCVGLNEVDRLNEGGRVATISIPVDAAERVSQVLRPHGYEVVTLAGTCWAMPV